MGSHQGNLPRAAMPPDMLFEAHQPTTLPRAGDPAAKRPFADRVALVTGSGRNLGRAIALGFARAGADVVIVARENRAEAESVAKEARAFGVRALPLLADVGEHEQVQAMAQAVFDVFGRVDVVVNNAAVRPRRAFLDIEPADWERVLRVNLTGAYYVCRAVLPSMVARGYGRIVNVSGADGVMGAAMRAHNVAAKAGLIGLTKAIAAEFGGAGITVNAVVPGLFDTTRDPGAYAESVLTAWTEGLPIRRVGQTDELANACLFLASEGAAYITGQSLHVNGGGLMP